MKPYATYAPDTLWPLLAAAVRDFVDTHGFTGAFVSLSGGIDSAVVAALAVEALGSSRVFAATYPSAYTSTDTLGDAIETAHRLGIPCPVVSIEPACRLLADLLPPPAAYAGAGLAEGIPVEENLQARIRGLLNMTLSNRHGLAVLCTGNRSETLTGYCTLYGDTCGAYAPLRDVYKTEVYALADHCNARASGTPPIPAGVIARAPTAELRPGQKDTDTLPPYPLLDRILSALADDPDDPLPPNEDVARQAEASPTEVLRVRTLLVGSAFKRLQAPPGPPLPPPPPPART